MKSSKRYFVNAIVNFETDERLLVSTLLLDKKINKIKINELESPNISARINPTLS
jgi:hypothetical protein